ncbi:MAG: hypothetical protein R2738_08740 [Bacteroides graminisolvens]
MRIFSHLRFKSVIEGGAVLGGIHPFAGADWQIVRCKRCCASPQCFRRA